MHQQLWGYKVEDKLYLGVREQKWLNTTGLQDRNILQTLKRRNANWIGHILRRNSLLKHVTEGQLEGKDRNDGKTRKKA
jgi:hypothetical protein